MARKPMPKTKVLSIHKFRRVARQKERRIQAYLDSNMPRGTAVSPVPVWAQGVRVRKAGAFSFVVEATDWQGH